MEESCGLASFAIRPLDDISLAIHYANGRSFGGSKGFLDRILIRSGDLDWLPISLELPLGISHRLCRLDLHSNPLSLDIRSCPLVVLGVVFACDPVLRSLVRSALRHFDLPRIGLWAGTVRAEAYSEIRR